MAILSKPLRIASLLGAIGLLLLAVGCGSGSAGSSGATETGASRKSGPEPSAEFLNKSDRSIVTFGKEASKQEREAVSAILTENFQARAEGDFATQCATLAVKAMEILPGASNTDDLEKNCVTAVRELATPLARSAKARKNTLSGSVPALRVQGNIARALYHGTDGKDYTIGLEREDGTWKVGSLVASEL
jgi:hypothetical protein